MGVLKTKNLENGKFLLDCFEFGVYYGFKFYSPETKLRGRLKQGNELVHSRAIFKHFIMHGVIEIEYLGYKHTFSFGKQYANFVRYAHNNQKENAFKEIYPKLTPKFPDNYVSFIDWQVYLGVS